MSKRMQMRSATAVLAAIAGLTVTVPVAQAWDVKYDFTASGHIYRFTGVEAVQVQGDTENVSGAVVFKVLRVAPPPDAYTDGTTIAAYNGDGWIETEWQGHTSAGEIEPLPLPTGILVHSVAVHNRYDPDTSDYSSQDTVKYYYDTSGAVAFGTRFAGIGRAMYVGVPWFAGLDFDPGVSPQYNFLWVADYSRDFAGNHTGFSGNFLIDSWTLASLDVLPIAEELAEVPQASGLAMLIRSVQAHYDAGDVTSACRRLAAFTRQAQGLSNNDNFSEMASDLILDARLIAKILQCSSSE
jgi:hypothetical protein